MADDPKPQNFWLTLPGILSATAAVITALTGLVVVLFQYGVIGGKLHAPGVAPTTEKLHLSKGFEPPLVKSAGINPPNVDPLNVSQVPTKTPPGPVSPNAPAAATPPILGAGRAGASSVAAKPVPATDVLVTTNDGTLVPVRGESFEICISKELTLSYGQSIPFTKIQSFDLYSDNGASMTKIALMDGRTINGKLANPGCGVTGQNDDGYFSNYISEIKRVEFRR